jgi:putrescine importer
VLSLWTLVLFGLAFVGPTAPFTFFGIGSQKSQGHFASVYLIAMVAVSFTAVSYGRMAAAFPEAGSTYAYAARALHPAAGFFAGWIMLLDYVLMPLLCVIIISANLASLTHVVPYPACVLVCAGLMTGVNLRGIKATLLATILFNAVLAFAIVWFAGAAVRWLVFKPLAQPSEYLVPFLNRRTFSLHVVMATTPSAVLSFLGFDGISTMAEDAEEPEKNVARATLLVCLIAGRHCHIKGVGAF